MFPITFLATAFFALCLSAPPAFGKTAPYTNKQELKAAINNIVAAIMNEDVSALMELTHLPGDFQFDKEKRIKKVLKNYFNAVDETRKIELLDLQINGYDRAEVTVRVHAFARSDIDSMDPKPREELWKFIKEKRSREEQWLFVLGGTEVISRPALP